MAQNAAIERRYAVMRKAMIHAGCEPIEADVKTGLLDVSPRLRAMFGFSDGVLTASDADLMACMHPDDLPLYQEMQLASAETGEVYDIVIRTILSGGEIRHIKVFALNDQEGGRRFGLLQDVTETILTAQRLQNIIENMPDGFFLHDRHICYLYANAAGKELDRVSNWQDDALRGKSLWEILPELEPQLRIRYEQLLQDGVAISTLIETKGRIRHVHAYRTPDGLGVHVRDMTQEIEAQRTLAESVELSRLANKASRDVLFDWNIPDDTVVWSDAAQERYGYDPKVFPRTLLDWMSIIHPDDRVPMQARTNSVVEAGRQEPRTFEYRIIRSDLLVAHVIERSILLVGADGRPVRCIGTITDVTEMRVEEERLRAIVEVAADAIFEFDPKQEILKFSPGFQTAFGHETMEARSVPSPWRTLVHRDDHDRVMTEFNSFCQSQAPSYRSEFRLLKGDGSVAQVRLRARAVRAEDDKLVRVVGSLDDVSEQYRAEERLKQVERLEALGNLTGGVAHDFNNLLTIMLGNAELLEEDASLTAGSRERAAVILRAAERGAELTAGLLAFSGKQQLEPVALDAAAVLSEANRLLRSMLPADIVLEVLIRDDLWVVLADPAELNAAILNLAINARDAMPNGGKLLIECSNAHLDDADVQTVSPALSGDFLRIAVTDTGTGMTPAVAARIFEPYFTTKPRGVGTGLGLSGVRGFVQQSGGQVTVFTEPNRGTTISIYLPRSFTDLTETPTEPTATIVFGSGEHILVVEDNRLLLPHVRELIEGLGYRVSAATDGNAALAILEANNDIDLLFTDVIMPGGLNGVQLAKLAVASRPGLKVLFTSGYTEDVIVQHGRLDPKVELLSKPYRRHELARKLRKMIDGEK
jgi:PAS domain S-box-containing protein